MATKLPIEQQSPAGCPPAQELPPMHSTGGLRRSLLRRSLTGYTESNDKFSPVPVFEAQWGTRPTKIVVGYWKASNAPNERDRHAVVGVLGINDMFRVRVVRETRDGRYVSGNFPVGAGALWIRWHEMEPEPHLKDLNQNEVKEYVRARQYPVDRGETETQKVQNETHAVIIAQQRVMHGVKMVSPPEITLNGANGTHGRLDEVKAGPDDSDFNDAYVDSKQEMKTVINGQELSINRRRPDAPNGRHSLPNVESRQSSKAPIAARKEINTQDPRETERLKQAETRRPQFALEREVANTNNANLGKPMQHGSQLPQMVNNSCGRASLGHSFYSHDDLQCLERVWQMQEE
ncbi:hypothetical protein VD0002_g6387 [Verticillium dahliae]|uniref:Uncharacterized protein n=1 Tax=Verticillium dahliae TaxID=27337 RepID=A0AA44WNV6_VERDA|nr:hypothetical protein BJF96_g1945 [Verticillium dahliae]PNH48856.1 hypothetical protein VD0003_g8273 [Verticillium dahliae]PNH61413.1 hypothetical protein VD0002_g6387 [Verticillium dahliae]